MKTIKYIKEMQTISRTHSREGKTIAVVPTMGYLHTGHTSLIKKAKDMADIVITTLFVNPTQFGPNEDYEKYPRDFERDFKIAEENGCDYLFNPEADEMYAEGYNSKIEINGITDKFEGAFRPGHFSGVATVVAKLFNATLPDIAIFGQKDFQQTLVIKQMVRDLNFGIKIEVAPTIRERDGLALSSRNVYLSAEERKEAIVLYNAMTKAMGAIEKGERNREKINSVLTKELGTINTVRIDYAVACDAGNLEEPDEFKPGQEIVILLACYQGKTRLIDNMLLTMPK